MSHGYSSQNPEKTTKTGFHLLSNRLVGSTLARRSRFLAVHALSFLSSLNEGFHFHFHFLVQYQVKRKRMALRRRAAERASAASREAVDLDAMVASGPQGAYEALQLYRSKATRLRTKNDQRGA
jgi:hypothetical protein